MNPFRAQAGSSLCFRAVMCALGVGLLVQGLATVLALAFSDEWARRTHGLLNHDARHGWLHVVWGTAVVAILLFDRRERWLTPSAIVFGIFYLCLCLLGIVTHNPFGLLLGPGENVFHLIIGTIALAAGIVEKWQPNCVTRCWVHLRRAEF